MFLKPQDDTHAPPKTTLSLSNIFGAQAGHVHRSGLSPLVLSIQSLNIDRSVGWFGFNRLSVFDAPIFLFQFLFLTFRLSRLNRSLTHRLNNLFSFSRTSWSKKRKENNAMISKQNKKGSEQRNPKPAAMGGSRQTFCQPTEL